jgi:hypothetical protein
MRTIHSASTLQRLSDVPLSILVPKIWSKDGYAFAISYQLGYIFISTDINNFLLGSMCNVDIEMLSLKLFKYQCHV